MSTPMINAERKGVGQDTSVILVAVDDRDDSDYRWSLAAGIELARGNAASLLLYDRSTESIFVDPYPYPQFVDGSSPLDAKDARLQGREHLARKIEVSLRAGVPAAAWLPRTRGPKEMARCVRTFGVDAAILPASLGRPSLMDRLRRDDLQRFREELEVPILLATDDAKLQVLSDVAATKARAPQPAISARLRDRIVAPPDGDRSKVATSP